MKIGIVVSAYNNWRALDWTLLSYRVQSRPPDELIVAEDSEFGEVAEVVSRHAAQAAFPIRHLHQPDQGFRKCLILNKAIAAAASEFLIFTDADCVARADLVSVYERLAAPGRFVAAGSHVCLPEAFHQHQLLAEMITNQSLFDRAFLGQHGVRAPWARLMPAGRLSRLLDAASARNAFVGNNSGAWRADLLRVAGFDESMGYGGEDRNLGIRLNHAGVRGRRARHSLVCLHLDHARSYRYDDQVRANREWNRQLQRRAQVLPRQSLLMQP